MPGFLTERVNNQVLDCFFGGTPIAPPPCLYVGLSLDRAYKGGYSLEPRGTAGYRRIPIPNDRYHFPPATSGWKCNASEIAFPVPTAWWGTILSVFVADAPEGGNVLAMADLPTPRKIDGGDPAPFVAINALFLSHR
jgi:hypothetical protein